MKILAGDSEKLFTPSVNKELKFEGRIWKSSLPLKSNFLEILPNDHK